MRHQCARNNGLASSARLARVANQDMRSPVFVVTRSPVAVLQRRLP